MVYHGYFKLNLGAWSDGLGEVSFALAFANITNIEQSTDVFTAIDLTYEWNGTRELSAWINDDWELYDDDNITDLVEGSGGIIEFEGDLEINVPDAPKWIITAIECGFLIIGGISGSTALMLYRLNDEKDKLNKNLTFVGFISGDFKAPIGIKNIEIDVINYDIENSYNYVYIPKLKRYYYITNIQLVNKDYTHLVLQEDVLMSWKDLIGQQEALITRYGGSSDIVLRDDRFPVEDIPTVTYVTPTNVTGASVTRLKYTMDTITGYTTKKPNVLISSMDKLVAYLPDDTNNIEAPSGSGLPNIQSRRGAHEGLFLMNIVDYNNVLAGCIVNDQPASYIKSVILLPFDLTDVFPDAGSGQADRTQKFTAGKWTLDASGFVETGQESAGAPTFWFTKKGGSPYIVIADFSFSDESGIDVDGSYLDNAPNTQWEIYIPFVGWQLIDLNSVLFDRIMVYYTFDTDTGMSTAFIYNRTKQKIIWSGNCQIGMKLLLTTSNAEELARQKNATTLNLIMGLFSGCISTVAGAYSTNPIGGVAGGVSKIIGNIAPAINGYNSLIERAQMSFGSSDNALYAPNQVTIRKTTHNPILTTSDEISRFAKINGYPYRKYVLISSLTTNNYIEVGSIHFNAKGENIYSDEITEIVQLLQNGVIL